MGGLPNMLFILPAELRWADVAYVIGDIRYVGRAAGQEFSSFQKTDMALKGERTEPGHPFEVTDERK